MAGRKPLVVGSTGLPEQLQSGDTLVAPVTNADVYQFTNGEASPIVIGTPVYIQAATTVKKAKANAFSTAFVAGLVYDTSISNGSSGSVQTDGIMSLSTAQWDVVAGTTGGLTQGTLYFLDPSTAGMITATPPSTAGQVNTLIGIAINTQDMKLMLSPPIKL